MRSATLLALTTLAASVSAFFPWQGIVPSPAWGYGRFNCTIVNKDGSFSPNQTACDASVMKLIGTGVGNDDGNQGDGVKPITPQCSRFGRSGAYFCGIDSARCETDANCDNGVCQNGRCFGGFEYNCHRDDTKCSGLLYCNSQEFTATVSGTCGGIGSFCQDYTQGSKKYTSEQNFLIFNQNCASNYCNTNTGNCDTRKRLGESCKSDPDYACADGLTCKGNVCVNKASGATKARRAFHAVKRSALCATGASGCSASSLMS